MAALLLVACGGGGGGGESPESGDPSPVCEAGRVVECPCPGDVSGSQTCADDGSRWGSCLCEPQPIATDPRVACSDPIDVAALTDEQRCERPTPTYYITCDRAIVDSGVCEKHDGIYCCPTKS